MNLALRQTIDATKADYKKLRSKIPQSMQGEMAGRIARIMTLSKHAHSEEQIAAVRAICETVNTYLVLVDVHKNQPKS